MENIEINIPENARIALERLEKASFEAWCVGGCVRDAVRGTAPHDWDICTSAQPDEMLAVFKGLRTIPTGLKHGTLTVLIHGEPVEITTYRCDGDYTDHRRPDSVKFVRDIKSDLERRDFTMNAMCVDLRGNILDLFGGREDMEKRVIRCVGDPEKRFDEDALRIFRAVRFAAKTGFEIEESTAAAALEMRGDLKNVSEERLYSELKALIVQPYAGKVLREYREIIGTVIPELTACFDFKQNNPHHCYDVWEHITHAVENVPADETLRLTMLFHDIAKPKCFFSDAQGVSHFKGHPAESAVMTDAILRRLKSDNASREKICALIREHDNRLPPLRKAVRRFLSKYDREFFADWLIVRRADTLAQSDYFRKEKLEELDALERLCAEILAEEPCLKLDRLAVRGEDMAALGLKGREIGQMLSDLLLLVVDERIPNEKQALIEAAERIMDQ
ncbi:MAG: HD domain-containing protein [Ruminococcus sp.]|nr:HD domain-containing protein [Ruminococcus sp.]